MEFIRVALLLIIVFLFVASLQLTFCIFSEIEITIDLDTKKFPFEKRAFVLEENNKLRSKLTWNKTLSKSGNNEVPIDIYFAVRVSPLNLRHMFT